MRVECSTSLFTNWIKLPAKHSVESAYQCLLAHSTTARSSCSGGAHLRREDSIFHARSVQRGAILRHEMEEVRQLQGALESKPQQRKHPAEA
jgi:hypothetical protein